jgi:cytosine/uracil/thiamine/allantoin permease
MYFVPDEGPQNCNMWHTVTLWLTKIYSYWYYSLVPGLTVSTMLLHSILLAVLVFQLLTPLCLTPSSILSIRLTWGRPTFLVPLGFVNVSSHLV